jgi:hypothetical protein
MKIMGKASTCIVFPNYIGGMTGLAYVHVGVRKVWATLTNGETLSIPRSEFPSELPDGNALAFMVAQAVTHGPGYLKNSNN